MTTHDLEPVLAEHPFFHGLEPEQVRFLVGCAKNVRFQAEERLATEGEPADWFYLLRAGRVAVEISVPSRPAVIIETLEPGEVLGWSWLFPPHRWAFSARALEATRALAFDGACLREKCDEDPRLGYALMKRFARVMVERLQATRLQILDVYGHREPR